jgi:hypothetical protein
MGGQGLGAARCCQYVSPQAGCSNCCCAGQCNLGADRNFAESCAVLCKCETRSPTGSDERLRAVARTHATGCRGRRAGGRHGRRARLAGAIGHRVLVSARVAVVYLLSLAELTTSRGGLRQPSHVVLCRLRAGSRTRQNALSVAMRKAYRDRTHLLRETRSSGTSRKVNSLRWRPGRIGRRLPAAPGRR